jgi:hypothetical protein
MTDDQLISFVLNEGHQITSDAFLILRDEFVRRNLDLTPLESSEDNRELVHQEKIKKVKESSSEEFLNSAWNYVLSQIEMKRSILLGLKEMGIEEKEGNLLLNGSESKAAEALEKHNNQITLGFISIGLSILILMVTANNGRSLLLWPALVFGIYKLYQGYSQKGKYLKTIRIIKERNPSISKSSGQN